MIFIPSVARFINLSHGDRARIAWGSQISICLYFSRRCPRSCLATKPNRDRWQLCTLLFLHFLLALLCTFACWHVYSSSVSKLLDQFLMQIRDMSKDSNTWFNKWLEIHSRGDLQLKLSVNADLKFSANNEGERDDDKKARVENISFTGNSLAKTKAVSRTQTGDWNITGEKS